MAFGIVGTPTVIASGGTYTPESGSNRLVVMLACIKAGTPATLTNIAYTGQTRTPTVTIGDTVENRCGVGICVFKESELGGSTTVTATWSETQVCAIMCFTISDADQSTSVRTSGSAAGVATDSVAVTGVALSGLTAGDLSLGCVCLRQIVTVTQQNSWTEDFDATLDPGGSDGRYSSAHHVAGGTSDTYSMAEVGLNSSYAMAAVSIIPAAAGGTVNTVSLSDSIAMVDAALQSAIRGVLFSDTVSIADSFFLWWYRTRVLQSSVVVTEGSTDFFTTTNMLAFDELTIADEFAAYFRRTRLGEDSIAITDEMIATTIGYLIFISVLTSHLTITDEALPYRYFSRLLESGLLTSDQAMRSVFVARALLDTVDIIDQNLTALQRFILLTDALSIDDSMSSLLVSSVTSNPIIVIGFDQPRIEIGGYGL